MDTLPMPDDWWNDDVNEEPSVEGPEDGEEELPPTQPDTFSRDRDGGR